MKIYYWTLVHNSKIHMWSCESTSDLVKIRHWSRKHKRNRHCENQEHFQIFVRLRLGLHCLLHFAKQNQAAYNVVKTRSLKAINRSRCLMIGLLVLPFLLAQQPTVLLPGWSVTARVISRIRKLSLLQPHALRFWLQLWLRLTCKTKPGLVLLL